MAKGKSQKISAYTDFKVADGYVFYDRLKQGEGHWKNLCHRAQNELNNITDLTKKEWNQISSVLYSLGQAELAKERALLRKYVPDLADLKSPTDEDFYKWLIEQINVLIQGRQSYENMLQVLNNAIEHSNNNPASKERSPMISSYFMSYFQDNLTKRMNDFQKYVKNNCLTANSVNWETEFKKAIELTIDDTIKDMSNVKEKYADDQKVWKDILAFYNSSPIARSDLYKTIHTQLNFDELKRVAIEQAAQTKRGYGHLDKNQIKAATTIEEKETRTLGGYIYESIANMFAGAKLIVTEGRTDVFIKNLESNMARTDSVILFSANSQINGDQVLDNFNNSILGSTSLEETRQKMQDFYNKNLANLTDSFLIFVSTKSYALTKGFEKYGFSDGSSEPLSHLPSFLANVGVDYGQADLFIKKIYSTIPGGLIEGKYPTYIEALRSTIIEALAYMMFDDWEQIGEQQAGMTNIHLFNLDGIYIPLSMLLMSLGQASERQPEGYFRVSFQTPKNIMYPTPITEVSSVDELDTYWYNQNKQMNNFKFIVKFLTNFKSIVRGLI